MSARFTRSDLRFARSSALVTTLLAFAALPACAAQTSDSATQEGASETTASTGQALGSGFFNTCPSSQQYVPAVDHLTDPDNDHMQYSLCVPTFGDHINIMFGRYGEGPLNQVENKSGTLDLWGMPTGAYHWFKAQGCDDDGCSPWNGESWIYNGYPGSHWVDIQRPDRNNWWSIEGAGHESYQDGATGPLFACASMLNGGTHIGKWSPFIPSVCFVSWGGKEYPLNTGMVLNSTPGTYWNRWQSPSYLGPKPMPGGWVDGGPQYICRAPHFNPITQKVDVIPGKVLANGLCAIPWGGSEFLVASGPDSQVEVLNLR